MDEHKIWFEEAQQVFDHDTDHSDEEDRFLLLDLSASTRLLVVVYCERDEGNLLRIISARKATKKEAKRYEKGI